MKTWLNLTIVFKSNFIQLIEFFEKKKNQESDFPKYIYSG